MDRLTDSLWIGDIQDARTRPLADLGIDHVVTVCQNRVDDNLPDSMAYTHIDIDDGPHDYEEFKRGVDTVVEAIDNGETVFVHCHAGMSRSTCTCTAAIAVRRGLKWTEAVQFMHDRYHRMMPSVELARSGGRYVLDHMAATR
ncbi:dual specificity protein phosphatase family protein (plasmid) [Halorarum halophilum]|uniref:protein-tyrosine-phosphatase n=1 Tax=Halorarum halophilum TaxID=2743090 RepID=A0A7D5GKT5_9EURY|nr:dual specificity protein phosphatase [Halobaculum halophilum]QLG30051.1 dual specificity protein phosphatase family protein [Halobaculum halophilum]